jgi:hypothetical protein
MKKSFIAGIVLVGCIVSGVFGDNTTTAAQVDQQAWNAITNKFYSDLRGQLLYRLKDKLHDEPIITNLVQNGCLSAIIPKARIYQIGVINVKNNFIHEKASLVVDENRFTFIETDEQAVDFLNSNRCQKVFSAVRAVQEVLAFGELRGISIMTEEKARILRSSLSGPSKISNWSLSVREGEKVSTIEATFITMYRPGSIMILWSKRYVFKFRIDGKMILEKIEDSGSVGGFH